jgi:ATP synthase protein I
MIRVLLASIMRGHELCAVARMLARKAPRQGVFRLMPQVMVRRCGFLRIIRGFAKFRPHEPLRFIMESTTGTQVPRDVRDADEADGGFGPEFKPLSAEEAAQWRSRQPAAVSLWRVVWIQAGAGGLVAVVAAWVGGWPAGVSAAWGGLSVVLPAMLFARGLSRSLSAPGAGAALVGLMVWESVKVLFTLVMLALAPQVLPGVVWPALVAGFVVTLKMYWLAGWLHVRRARRAG